MSEKNYHVVIDRTGFEEMLTHVKNHDVIAYDTETTGLNTRKCKVIGFSVSGQEGFGYYLPLYYWDGSELKQHHSESLLRANKILKLLENKKLIMHNASYDVRVSRTNFSNINLLDALHCDTILLKHAVDEERPFGLKDIAKKIQKELGLDISKAANEEQIEMVESIKANGGSVTKGQYELYKADMAKIGIYACADTDLTLRVFNYYSKKLEEENLVDFFYKDETMPLLREVTIPMEMNGIPVDVQGLEFAYEEIQQDLDRLENEIQKKLKPDLDIFTDWYLNLKFPPQRSGAFAQVLCEHGDLDLPRTGSGRYSLTNSNLSKLPMSPHRDFLLGEGSLPSELIRELQLKMFKMTGEQHMFNLSSKHHLKKLFFDTYKERPLTTTDKGNPQVNDDFLELMEEKYDWVRDLRDYNRLSKIKGAYLERFLDQHEDGVFYPQFYQHRTISGRYGSDIQQLSRPYEQSQLDRGEVSPVVFKHTNIIRKLFISGENYVFIDADYTSLEPHVFAHVSGDEGLKDIFRNNHDFYSTVAIATERLEGVSADKEADNYLGKVDKPLRQKAKAYSLGIPYGLEAFKLSKELNIPQRTAERLIRQYLSAYPELHKWMKNSNKACYTDGYIRSEAGRVRHMPKAPKIWYAHKDYILDSLELWKKFNDNPREYSKMKFLRKEMRNYLNNAKNFQIQSLAASITNRSCIAIARELKRLKIKGYICCQTHDQIIVRVPEEYAEKCKRMVQYLMENTYKISLKLEAPAQIARDFYEGH